jgi:ATP-binding cassette subfamily B protein
VAHNEALTKSIPGLSRIARRFWPHLRKERRLIATSLLALLAEVGLRLLEPWPLKFVFDSVLASNPASNPSGVPFLDKLDPSTLLIASAVAVVAITALRALAAYINTVGFAMVGNRVLTRVRSDLYAHMQRLSLSFHTKARGGDLVVRVISDVSQLKDVAITALLPLVAHGLILLGMVGLMAWLNWQLTLLALVTVPLFWLSTMRLTKRIQDAARKQRKREGAMAATASESLGAIKIVQALSLENILSASFFSQNKESLKQDAKASKLSASLERTVDVLIAVSTGLVLWYGATLVMNKSLTPGDLLVFLTYLKNAFKPVRDFAKYTGRLAKATAAGERVLDLLDREPDVQDLPNARPAPALRGAVAFENVSFAYEPGHPVLRDINLNIEPGRCVALVGPSGNGKSTLVGMILRLYDPSTGSVKIDGRDIRDYTLDSLRAQVGVVMQDTVLFAASARDNIAYGAPQATDEEIIAAARLANAHDFIEALPEGYDTILGERGSTLSNGQRQRIAIARAAIRRAPILILDEPTTGLDEENERAVMEALQRLMVGRTTFLITHKLAHAQFADTVMVLENGRIVEQGSYNELLKGGRLHRQIYTVKTTAREDGVHHMVPSTRTTRKEHQIVLATLELSGRHDTAWPDGQDGDKEKSLNPPTQDAEVLAALPPYVSQTANPRHLSRRWTLAGGLGAILAAVVVLAVATGTGVGVLGAKTVSVPSTPAQNTPITSIILPTQVAAVPPIETAQARMGSTTIEGRSVVTFSGELTGVVATAWSPDNRRLALGSMDRSVRILDTQTGKVATLKGHKAEVFNVSWSPDGQTLASGGADRTVRLWSAEGKPVALLEHDSGLSSSFAWMPDGKTLASVSTGLDLFLWGPYSEKVTYLQGGANAITSLRWSPDGSTLAAGSNDRSVRLWRADGTLIKTLYGHDSEVYCLAWSPDGKILASGSNDKTVRLWSASGDALATLSGHTEFVNSVAWSPDGSTLASAGDRTARLWNPDGTSAAVLTHPAAMVLTVAWSPDGKTLATSTADDTVWLWR